MAGRLLIPFMQIIFSLSLLASLFTAQPVVAQTIPIPSVSVYKPVTASSTDFTMSASSTAEYIAEQAKENGIDPQLLLTIAGLESSFNTKAVGDSGLAHGAFQIRQDFHPDISIKQAEDLEFATSFAIKEIKAGHCKWMWSTCPIR